MKPKLIALIGACTLLVSSFLQVACTENERAKSYGGSTTITLPANTKLVNVTWEGASNLWYLTRARRPDEQTETYTFQEKSTFGSIEGTVIFKEK
jgi:hypothetical protein